MSHLVAIVGRPNVGKSTLFNRMTQTRGAIVSEEAGTTRDRQYGKVTWLDREFSIVDTGGWVVGSEDIFEGEINKQVEIAMEEADVILFVVDVETKPSMPLVSPSWVDPTQVSPRSSMPSSAKNATLSPT